MTQHSNPPKTITSIPAPTYSKIRSTLSIASLSTVLTELIQNSLDAQSTRIDCWIDSEGWGVRVSDNGNGITAEGMKVVGERYATSKSSHNTEENGSGGGLGGLGTFGFRGEGLASIAALSLLQINSRLKQGGNGNDSVMEQGYIDRSYHQPIQPAYAKVIKGGKVLSCGPTSRVTSEASGTTVTVKDLFYNVPVRRPQSQSQDPFLSSSTAITNSNTNTSSSSYSTTTTINACKKSLEIAALVHPKVSFSLTLEGDCGSGNGNGLGREVKRLLTIPSSLSGVVGRGEGGSLSVFRRLFGRSLVENVREIHVSNGDKSLRIDGFVSLNGGLNKAHQFLYVNKFHLNRCELHKVIESRFASSSFGRKIEDEEDFSPIKTLKSPKTTDLKPVYVLNVRVSSKKVDMAYEPAKGVVGLEDWNLVARFLTAVIDDTLIKEGLMNSPVPPRKSTTTNVQEESPTRWKRPGSPIARPRSLAPRIPQNGSEEASHDVEPGIGFRKGPGVYLMSAKRLSLLPEREGKRKEGMPEWISDVLKGQDGYDKPTQRVQVNQIIDPSTDTGDNHGYTSHRDNLQTFDQSSTLTNVTFTREQLSQATVISQVDGKFICCSLPGQNSEDDNTLVMIDQHAADERIRVEKFLSLLCEEFRDGGVVQQDLTPDPHLIVLTDEEVHWLQARREHLMILERWGIKIDIPDHDLNRNQTQSGYTQVEISAVPALLTARMGGKSGKDVKKVVQRYMAYLQQEGTRGLETLIEQLERNDGRAVENGRILRWCPKRMIELINSKACRGAIMFNDPLTKAQCQDLISKLSRTKFPFMCAHGRPSVAPLMQYYSVRADSERKERRAVDWSRISL